MENQAQTTITTNDNFSRVLADNAIFEPIAQEAQVPPPPPVNNQFKLSRADLGVIRMCLQLYIDRCGDEHSTDEDGNWSEEAIEDFPDINNVERLYGLVDQKIFESA